MSIANAYSAWSASYDADCNRTRDLDAEVTRRLLGHECLPVVVEAGCGTGKNTGHFASMADLVLALDFSEGMLAVARRRITAANVRFQQADLCAEWPCPANLAQLVAFHLVLEHIEDLAPVFGQAARTLAPGGTVHVSELHPGKQYQGSQARFLDAEGRQVQVQAYTHHISDFIRAAGVSGLVLRRLDEWWHHEDSPGGVPRLVTFQFQRPPTHGAFPAPVAGNMP